MAVYSRNVTFDTDNSTALLEFLISGVLITSVSYDHNQKLITLPARDAYTTTLADFANALDKIRAWLREVFAVFLISASNQQPQTPGNYFEEYKRSGTLFELDGSVAGMLFHVECDLTNGYTCSFDARAAGTMTIGEYQPKHSV